MTDAFALGKITAILRDARMNIITPEVAILQIAETVNEAMRDQEAVLVDMEARFESSSQALGVAIENFHF